MELPPSVLSVVKLEVIKHDLQTAVNQIVEEIECKAAHSSGEEASMPIDFTWIGMEVMKKVDMTYNLQLNPPMTGFFELSLAIEDPFEALEIVQFRPRRPSAAYDLAKPGLFFTLPRELRDMIYPSLVRAGDVAMLRACRQVFQEMSPLLAKEGTSRLRVELTRDYIRTPHLSGLVAANIQNVDIRIILSQRSNYNTRHQAKAIFQFAGNNIIRENYRIHFLIFRFVKDRHDFDELEDLLHATNRCIGTLFGFKRIFVDVEIHDPVAAERWGVNLSYLQFRIFQKLHRDIRYLFDRPIMHRKEGPFLVQMHFEYHPQESRWKGKTTTYYNRWLRKGKH